MKMQIKMKMGNGNAFCHCTDHHLKYSYMGRGGGGF